MPLAAEINFSELSNKPADSVRKLQAAPNQTLLVHRRGDEEDLVLTTASRAEEVREVVSFTTSLFVALIRHSEEARGMIAELTPTVFPWVRFLPPEEREHFIVELVEILEASNSLGTPAPVVQLITEWKHTAEVWADPRLVETFTRDDGEDDDEEVPEPGDATA
ncbi:hypothetical protein ACFOWZ_10725 [Lentzea rhizosphaerae]|uniref:Prevent-host-death family protein n=1 Tax=Lentzea rhizosphaerae TaxID=2041025 RepID=A0ABV8BPY3_9PSEU